ncbi:MAG: cupin domain-containing protein [Haloarculaceae archaeon]
MSEDTGSEDERSYRHLHVEDAYDAPSLTDHKYELDEAVGAREFGFNVYVASEGQPIPWGRHHHPEHEEAFYVLEGGIVAEMGPEGETETLHVGQDEAVFVPPGTWNRAVATADGTRVVAVGAPKASDGAVIREPCGACSESTGRDYDVEEGGDVYVLYCAECGVEADRLVAGVR